MITPARTSGFSATNQDVRDLVETAIQRVEQGLAPPPEIYRVLHREAIDWNRFPEWARPLNPEIFDGCCHEG